MYIIESLWILIKEFLLDYKKTHQYRFNLCLEHFDGLYSEIFFRWSTNLPRTNTNDIINHEYMTLLERIPRPNLELTSVTYNKYSNGFIGGYGWEKQKKSYGSYHNLAMFHGFTP
jgi:hypothetical protein